MKRTLTNEILKILHENRQRIILHGTPGVGKTHLLQDVADHYNGSYIMCDLTTDREFFNALSEFTKAAYDTSTKESSPFVRFLSEYFQVSEEALSNTLVIFDGIERLSDAVTVLFQYELPTYFIAATSRADLLAGIPMPLSAFPPFCIVPVRPLSFCEFLDAIGQEWYHTVINGHVERSERIPELLQTELNELFHDYLLVGGYPEAIKQYIDNPTDISSLRSVHDRIYSTIWYRYVKHLPEHLSTLKLEQIMRYVSENAYCVSQPFHPAYIRKGTSINDYSDELDYLFANGLLIPVYDSEYSLSRFEVSDCGLMRYLCNDYDLFYSLDRESEAFPNAFYQNYVYTVLYRQALPITSWKHSRSYYTAYHREGDAMWLLCGEPAIRSRLLSTIRSLKEKSTIWLLTVDNAKGYDVDHNIQYYSLESTLILKNNMI